MASKAIRNAVERTSDIYVRDSIHPKQPPVDTTIAPAARACVFKTQLRGRQSMSSRLRVSLSEKLAPAVGLVPATNNQVKIVTTWLTQ